MGRTAAHKRDWCSQCNCWHYEGDLHLSEQIEKLEAELAQARADIVELNGAIKFYGGDVDKRIAAFRAAQQDGGGE